MSQSTFVKSTIILTIATLLSKVLGSIFRIPLQNIAGDEVLGIFTLVYPVYMVALYLSVAGIPLAISKLIAEAHAKNEQHKVKEIYFTASILALCFGVLSFAVIMGFSTEIANALGGPSTEIALIVVALTLLVAPYMAVYRGFFQGFGNMQPTAVSQVIEQLVRVCLILLVSYILVAMNYSTEIVSGGVMIGSVIGALASLFFLRFQYTRSSLKVTSSQKVTLGQFKSWSKVILKISIPIAIGSVTMALFNFVDSFTVTYGLRSAGVEQHEITYQYGIYGRGLTLVQIATIFASSIILPLVPLITKKLTENDLTGTRALIERTHRLTHLISWPAALGLLALTLPLNLALFTDLEGSTMLAIINLSSVFTSLTILGTGILQGMNSARAGAIIILGGVLLKVFANIFFIRSFGLDGAAFSTLFVYFVLFIVNTAFIYKKMRFSFINGSVVKIIFASLLMGAVIGLPTLWFDIAGGSRFVALAYVVVAMLVGGAIYLGVLWFTRAISHEDLKQFPVIGKRFNGKQLDGKPSQTNERKNKLMIKQKWLWGILLLVLIASLPGVINRWHAESANDNYEVIIPYKEIATIVEESDLTADEVLSRLADAGLTSVSVEAVTLEDLEKQNVVSIYEENELANSLLFTQYEGAIDTEETGYYVTVPEDSYYQNFITENIQTEEVTVAGKPFYFIASSTEDFELDMPFGYDQSIVDQLDAQGLMVVFRTTNIESDAAIAKIVNQLIELKGDNKLGLLGSGTEVIGFGHPDRAAWLQDLQQAGYSFYTIEGSQLKGEYDLAKSTEYDMIRLHSIDVNKQTNLTVTESVDRTTRAVKERNIKSIFYHIKTRGDAEENLDEAVLYLTEVQDKMPTHFTLGAPKHFEKISVPSWVTALVLLGGIIFMYLISELIKVNKLRILAVLFMALLAVAYFILNRVLFLQAFALIIAVLTPIYAVIKSANGSTRIRDIFVQYIKGIAISLIGIYIVIGLLNGNGFVTGHEVFRGVKLVYVIPIAGIVLFALFQVYEISKNGLKGSLNTSVTLLNKEVKYWHVLVLIIVAAVGYFYIGRTGNSGSVTELELTFRQWLENTLYVRPRTKEFLIGFPFFVLALYVMGINKKWGTILLIPGVIGFLSIMNTFTHLHIPVSVSLLRTLYSTVLGFAIGLIFIVIFKICVHYFTKAKTRWS